MAMFQCISYMDITARCLPGEWEICGRSIANKKLITKSSEAKKPHGSMILFFALFAVFRLSGPSPSSLSPKFDANPILPANNVGSCPGEPECKLLCVNKISAAAIRTLWLSLPYLPFPPFVPFARENNTRMNHVCPLRNVRRICVYDMHVLSMRYNLRRNTHRDKKYDKLFIAQIFLTTFMFYFQFLTFFQVRKYWVFYQVIEAILSLTKHFNLIYRIIYSITREKNSHIF